MNHTYHIYFEYDYLFEIVNNYFTKHNLQGMRIGEDYGNGKLRIIYSVAMTEEEETCLRLTFPSSAVSLVKQHEIQESK